MGIPIKHWQQPEFFVALMEYDSGWSHISLQLSGCGMK